MGPRRRCRGRWSDLAVDKLGLESLQWGHDEGVVEDGTDRRTVNARAIKLQWGHDEGSWKCCRTDGRCQFCSPASMGPRRRCRGSAFVDPLLSEREDRFNGATTKVSWKCLATVGQDRGRARRFNGATTKGRGSGAEPVIVQEPTPLALQWGHDEGVVEVTYCDKAISRRAVASMGPRRRCRGSADRRLQRRQQDRSFNGATTKVSWKCTGVGPAGLRGIRASMGPRRRCRGSAAEFTKRNSEALYASMGPRRRCRGSVPGNVRDVHSLIASMGPRRRCRGSDVQGYLRPNKQKIGFNGATTKVSWKCDDWVTGRVMEDLLQWGHDEGVVEDAVGRQTIRRRHDMSFNGATTKVSWKCGHHLHHESRGGRFNGATTKVSWKCRLGLRRGDAILRASMGPRRRCRGRWGKRIGGLERCFVASMGPRRRCRGSAVFDMKTTSTTTTASMGPRRRCRGSVPRNTRRPGSGTLLQWGHDEGVVEVTAKHGRADQQDNASMGPRRRCRGRCDGAMSAWRGRSRLQWGHDEGVVEVGNRRQNNFPNLGASMGPRRRCRGSGVQVGGNRECPCCFNGATTKVSWKCPHVTPR